MKLNEMFPSSYFRADDLKERERLLQMSHVEMKEFKTDSGSAEIKPVLFFTNEDKALALNQTNANAIADRFGDDSRQWGGEQIVLHAARVPFGNKIVDAVRVRTPPKPDTTASANGQYASNGSASTADVMPNNGNGAAAESDFGQHDEIPF